MNKKWMKLLSLLLALCTVLSLAVPAVSAEENDGTATAAEEEFVFPEFGGAYSVGEVLTGGMALTEYALLLEKNGDYFLMAAAKGGTLYVLKLSEYLRGGDGGGTFIEASVTHGISIPRGIVMDSQGVAYVIGDGGYVFCYDFYKNTTARINISSGSRAMTIDENDNLYVGTEGGGASQIIKIDLKNNNKQTVLFETNEVTGCGAMHYGDGDIYMWGNPAGMPNGFHLWRIDATTGEVKAKHTNTTDKYGYYLSYIDGVLFGGHSAAMDQAWVFDAKTLEPIDVGLPDWIMGVVTTPNEEGKSYVQVSANGVFEYDTKTRTTKRVEMLNAWNINLRIRDAYLDDVDFDGINGKVIATMASGHGLPSILSIEGQGFRELEPLVEETISPATLRSVATAVPGVKVVHSNSDVLKGTPQEAAVYIGGYLSGNVAAYYPGAEEEEFRVDSPIFTNGHAQTDSMLVYKGKLYAGCYNGGYVVQYDPATDTDIQMIPNGLKEQYKQIRVHGLSAGDDKIFFSTIPGDQEIGGAIGWIDIPKFEAGAPIEEYMYVERNVVFEQSVTSIVYDEERNILFGSASLSGGTNSGGLTSQTEAYMLAYDVDNKKVLGTFSVRAEENPNSDMAWENHTIPTYLGGIARDPDTGKFWGTVSKCIYSFEYDEKNNTMKIHEEYVHPGNNSKDYYPIGGNPNWFPRPFAFDGKGNFYIWILGHEIYRFDVNDPANPVMVSKKGGRIYALGTDGNLYIGSGLELYKVALNRVDIVKGMIDGVEPRFGDQVKLARDSYEHLTEEEKAQLSEDYVEGLAALEGAAQIFLQVQADKVIDAIDEVGAVTVSSEGAIAAAREKYELLDEDAKPMVSNYQELVAMEAKFEEISAASSWGRIKQIPVTFSKKVNNRVGDTALQMTTFDHISGGIWEFGLSSSTNANVFKYNGGDHLQLNFGGGWVAFRVKISEPGLYTISMEGKGGSNTVKQGGLYMYDVNGIKTDHMYDLVNNEANMKSKNTQNFVCTVDYSVAGAAEQGKWYCDKPGEYLMVLNKLAGDTNTYGRPMSFTFSKRDATADAAVELVKERIDAIGKVNKNSGDKINDARITYDALTDAQKALIYAPQLEKAEAAYAEIAKLEAEKKAESEAKVLMVRTLIDSIGTVTEKSGDLIKEARAEFNKLSAAEKKQVGNEATLIAAEEAFAKFAQGQEIPVDGSGLSGFLAGIGLSMTAFVCILAGAGVLVVGLAVGIVVAKGKKKKATEEAAEEAAPEEATEE